MRDFTTLDTVVLLAYLAGITAFGVWFGGRQKDSRDYFLAGRGLPWWAICLSIVATETSALTFISIPATAYGGGLWMLQLALGYLIGRIGVAIFLLPGYFRGELTTAYALLERRFGEVTRRFASLIFMVTRALGDSVRIFAAAIPIALITGQPYWVAILLTGGLTVVYTYFGGLRAVVWTDVIQFVLYVFGGAAALYVLVQLVPGGWPGIVTPALETGRLQVFHLDGGFSAPRWIVTGLVGGAFLSLASHGVDHLIIQRLLAARGLPDARKAIIGSGVLVIAQFALFLTVGLGLFAYYEGKVFSAADEVFPNFIIEGLPPGISGLIIAAVLAAAMSTVSSSLNSLASATTHDIYARLSGRQDDELHLLRAGKVFTILWAVILIGGAILFQLFASGTPVVVVALQIASFTYGGLLGGFLLGIVSKHADQRDAIVGMSTAIAAMTLLWAAQTTGVVPRFVDTLWFALIGSAITVAVGTASAALRGGGRTPAVAVDDVTYTHSGAPEPTGTESAR